MTDTKTTSTRSPRATKPEVLVRADAARIAANGQLDESKRAELGQYMTSAPIASFMASLFVPTSGDVRLLDAGAGVGSLVAAYVAVACAWKRKPTSIEATCYEIDPVMRLHLRVTLDACEAACAAAGIRFTARIVEEDFVEAGSRRLDAGLFAPNGAPAFTAAILNPPYRKIHSTSRERTLLRSVGIETTNLYTAFVGLAVRLLEPGGQLVAITPRSFCNGPYFRPFRELLLTAAALRQVHVFESRDRAFRDDDVLQENIVFHAIRNGRRGDVTLSMSSEPSAEAVRRIVPYDDVVVPGDRESFIHLAISASDSAIADRMRRLPSTLVDLGLHVSTGRVVDFRVREHLRDDPAPRTVPLIYPLHFQAGFVAWPKLGGRKPNSLSDEAGTQSLLVPKSTYVLTKRFTSKEERRRVVAVVLDPSRLPTDVTRVAIENHVNYFHANGAGIRKRLARGLAGFLNSTLVDRFFRQFNGHTQVNAGDLRSLRYPSPTALGAIGRCIGDEVPDQTALDRIVDDALGR